MTRTWWVLVAWGLTACGGASIEGGEVRPFDGEGMRLVQRFDVRACNPATQPATTQVEVWSGASGGERTLVSLGPDRQALVVHRRFVVHGEERFEVVLEPSGGAPILQRFRLGKAPMLELIRNADAPDDAPSQGGSLVQRCSLRPSVSG
ncbi:MAG: hypothetical protein AB7K71_08170 [Polyangiaceae bacterium]